MITAPISIDCIMPPLSPKELRDTFIFIALHKGLLALAIILVILIGVTHPKNTNNTLQTNLGAINSKPMEREFNCQYTQHAKELGLMYEVSEYTYTENPTLSTTDTSSTLFFATMAATIYLESCLELLIGALLSWEKFFIPWLLADILSMLEILIVMLIAVCNELLSRYVDNSEFLCSCTILALFYLTTCGFMRKFYSKLVAIAQVRLEPLMRSSDAVQSLTHWNSNETN